VERRWGERQAANANVRLRSRAGVPVPGRLINVSASGALIATRLPAPVLSNLEVLVGSDRFGRQSDVSIPGQVIRRTPDGLAVEWIEFAPEPLRSLMGSLPVLTKGGAKVDERH
jgi:hypothetical protein